MIAKIQGGIKRLFDCLKKNKTRVIVSVFILVIWVLAFWGFYVISPRSSVIYYEGTPEELWVEVSEVKGFQRRVMRDSASGELMFKAPTNETIYAVNQELLLNSQWEDVNWEPYEDTYIFRFLEGRATLRSSDYLALKIGMPDGSSFSYTLNIENGGTNEDNAKINLISISDFPKEAIVTMYSNSKIDMNGNVSGNHMQSGEYRLINCDSVSFYQWSPSNTIEDSPTSNEVDQEWHGSISSFHIKNSERQVLEFTIDAQTEFREIGHVNLSGDAEKGQELTMEISDLSAYPIPVTLSGSVGRMEIAGHSLYLTPNQWFRANMTQILLALMGVIFSVIFMRQNTSSATGDVAKGKRDHYKARQKIMRKRISTKSRISLCKQGGIWRTSPW